MSTSAKLATVSAIASLAHSLTSSEFESRLHTMRLSLTTNSAKSEALSSGILQALQRGCELHEDAASSVMAVALVLEALAFDCDAGTNICEDGWLARLRALYQRHRLNSAVTATVLRTIVQITFEANEEKRRFVTDGWNTVLPTIFADHFEDGTVMHQLFLVLKGIAYWEENHFVIVEDGWISKMKRALARHAGDVEVEKAIHYAMTNIALPDAVAIQVVHEEGWLDLLKGTLLRHVSDAQVWMTCFRALRNLASAPSNAAPVVACGWLSLASQAMENFALDVSVVTQVLWSVANLCMDPSVIVVVRNDSWLIKSLRALHQFPDARDVHFFAVSVLSRLSAASDSWVLIRASNWLAELPLVAERYLDESDMIEHILVVIHNFWAFDSSLQAQWDKDWIDSGLLSIVRRMLLAWTHHSAISCRGIALVQQLSAVARMREIMHAADFPSVISAAVDAHLHDPSSAVLADALGFLSSHTCPNPVEFHTCLRRIYDCYSHAPDTVSRVVAIVYLWWSSDDSTILPMLQAGWSDVLQSAFDKHRLNSEIVVSVAQSLMVVLSKYPSYIRKNVWFPLCQEVIDAHEGMYEVSSNLRNFMDHPVFKNEELLARYDAEGPSAELFTAAATNASGVAGFLFDGGWVQRMRTAVNDIDCSAEIVVACLSSVLGILYGNASHQSRLLDEWPELPTVLMRLLRRRQTHQIARLVPSFLMFMAQNKQLCESLLVSGIFTELVACYDAFLESKQCVPDTFMMISAWSKEYPDIRDRLVMEGASQLLRRAFVDYQDDPSNFPSISAALPAIAGSPLMAPRIVSEGWLSVLEDMLIRLRDNESADVYTATAVVEAVSSFAACGAPDVTDFVSRVLPLLPVLADRYLYHSPFVQAICSLYCTMGVDMIDEWELAFEDWGQTMMKLSSGCLYDPAVSQVFFKALLFHFDHSERMYSPEVLARSDGWLARVTLLVQHVGPGGYYAVNGKSAAEVILTLFERFRGVSSTDLSLHAAVWWNMLQHVLLSEAANADLCVSVLRSMEMLFATTNLQDSATHVDSCVQTVCSIVRKNTQHADVVVSLCKTVASAAKHPLALPVLRKGDLASLLRDIGDSSSPVTAHMVLGNVFAAVAALADLSSSASSSGEVPGVNRSVWLNRLTQVYASHSDSADAVALVLNDIGALASFSQASAAEIVQKGWLDVAHNAFVAHKKDVSVVSAAFRTAKVCTSADRAASMARDGWLTLARSAFETYSKNAVVAEEVLQFIAAMTVVPEVAYRSVAEGWMDRVKVAWDDHPKDPKICGTVCTVVKHIAMVGDASKMCIIRDDWVQRSRTAIQGHISNADLVMKVVDLLCALTVKLEK